MIICRRHGEFERTPSAHLRGSGCPLCPRVKKSKKKTTLKSIIERAKNIHGDKYDYSLVDYDKTTDKVIIVCKKHGNFIQRLHNHLSGNGCPKCSHNISKFENEISEFLIGNNVNIMQNYRGWNSVSENLEIDIFLNY